MTDRLTATPNGRHVPEHQALVKGASTYMRQLGMLGHAPIIRASDPYSTHAWVFAAATAIAKSIATAPLRVWSETSGVQDERARRFEARHKGLVKWRAPRGTQRASSLRWQSERARMRGLQLKGLEVDVDHPLNLPLLKPNAFMSGDMLVSATSIWLSVKGECFWLLLDSDDQPIDWSVDGAVKRVASIWPIDPALIQSRVVGNKLIGWGLSFAHGVTNANVTQLKLNTTEIIHFKYFNPSDPIRGMAPITAASMGIALDMMAQEHNRAILQNGAEPGGILQNDTAVDADEEDAALEAWNQRHGGTNNRRKITTLTGGWRWVPVALTLEEMQYREMLGWDRDTVLAVLGVQRTKVSVTEGVPYALGQVLERQHWDDAVQPPMRVIESTLDGTLLFTEPDTTVAMFDLSQVDALRVGTAEKIAAANNAVMGLRMPPGKAAELVGLDAGEWPGHDRVLVSPMLVPVEDVLEGLTLPGESPPPPADGEDQDSPPTDEEDEDEDEVEDEDKRLRIATRAPRTRRLWQAYVLEVHAPAERKHARVWRSWVKEERSLMLAAWDDAFGKSLKAPASATMAMADIDAVLPRLGAMQGRLGEPLPAMYESLMPSGFKFFTEEVGGVTVFTLDDPAITHFLSNARKMILGTAPRTLQHALRSQLVAGFQSGMSIQEMRGVVSRVFGAAASPAKTLMVARTESTRLMNGARDVMFDLSGVSTEQWLTAGDEHVRDDHVTFGSQEPQASGTNYLQFVGKDAMGYLAYPGDARAGADQVVNCRCMKIPVG